MHGHGKCEFFGSIYEGEWELNKKHGKGIQQYSDGSVFEGEFRNNLPRIFLSPFPFSKSKSLIYWDVFAEGQGELLNTQGDRYVGEFGNGKRHGQGEMSWTNGDRYVGEWKADNMSGYFNYFSFVFSLLLLLLLFLLFYIASIWLIDLVGIGTVVLANGVTYMGQWADGLVRLSSHRIILQF